MSTSGLKRTLDRRVWALMAKQHGMISRAQAYDLGLSAGRIHHRLSTGSWEVFLPRVLHAVEVPVTWQARLVATCLWAGDDAAISHRAAAAFWELDGFGRTIIDVTTTRHLQSGRGVTVHRSPRLPASHIARVGPVRVTTVHRTLVDLGAMAPPDLVEQALECALRRRITSEHRLQRHIQQLGTRGRKGPAVLNSLILNRAQGVAPTESSLETETLRVLRRHGLPEPVRQLIVRDSGGFIARVDLAYPDERVLIEVDSRSHHLRRRQWEQDLARRNELTSRGWSVLHATKERLRYGATAFVDCIRRARGTDV